MSRRDVREKIIQALYQLNFHPEEYTFPDDWLEGMGEADSRFYRELWLGIGKEGAQLEQWINRFLKGWTLNRLSLIDQAILRLGTYELIYRADIPAGVSLNEAVELAKRYSTDESAHYLNGVLSQIRRHAEQAEEQRG